MDGSLLRMCPVTSTASVLRGRVYDAALHRFLICPPTWYLWASRKCLWYHLSVIITANISDERFSTGSSKVHIIIMLMNYRSIRVWRQIILLRGAYPPFHPPPLHWARHWRHYISLLSLYSFVLYYTRATAIRIRFGSTALYTDLDIKFCCVWCS